MFSTLYYSLKIDTYYAINSFIYYLRKTPIFKDFLTPDAYNSKILKCIAGIIGIVLSLGKTFLNKFIYFLVIYYISKFISGSQLSFYHLFFFLTLIGMFINNNLLNSNMNKYLNINIFKMDAKNYLKYNLFWLSLNNIIFNFICFMIFGNNIGLNVIMVLFQACVRIIGESLNVWYFRKYYNYWYNNTILYFGILISLLLCSITPLIGLIINKDIIILSFIISIILSIVSYIYFNSFNDYKYLLKSINTLNNALSSDLDNRQNFVMIRDKDIELDSKKLKNKSGYDYFNTIFFERHKDILYRSSRNYSIILLIIYSILAYYMFKNNEVLMNVQNILENKLSIFVVIMYFINRGGILTQAMFYNCDHAMLKYNFFREEKVIIGLFWKRLLSTIKVNLMPCVVIVLGNILLFLIAGNYNILNMLFSSLFIVLLSILFSVHSLVVYYLLQPYDKDMKIKKISFSVVNLIIIVLCLLVLKVNISNLMFLIYGLIIVCLYIIIALKLIKKYAPITFKINR